MRKMSIIAFAYKENDFSEQIYRLTTAGKDALELTKDLIPGIVKLKIDSTIKGELQDIEEEISILSEYLPKQLSKEEIIEIVKQVIVETEATTIKDMGKVMKGAKEKCGAAADGKTINEVVKELLN